MSGTHPTVTAVIPFYNDPFVGEAVESALAQTYPAMEIIVVNDGSTREAERLLPYRGRIHELGKANGGTATALNHGFRLASGTYVAWLSSDDRWAKDKIAKQVDFMERSGAWISHTGFRWMDERGKPERRAVWLEFENMHDFYKSFLKSNAVNGCTVMMRKSLFDQLGGFDERLPFTHDYDFWLRAILGGYPLSYLPDALTDYRRHPAMGSIRHKAEIEREFQAVSLRYRDEIARLLTALRPPARVSLRGG
ncbi:glycosyltransferase [Cohnella sp. REN36]|uniref:glycosyltransferase family 2 protein n=1 Tax=Cohnella sp. REN36 TaxID=2887347 RepID=UPI001D14932F|nr:glycosyltransferase [Cohnella sp. REN36]MCC3377296.1 glycosyltransferase [Cohnella sp. REN36]